MDRERVIEKLREAKSSVDMRGTNATPILHLIDAFVGCLHIEALTPEAEDVQPEPPEDEFDVDSLKQVYAEPKPKPAAKKAAKKK